jgi:hypothetical protein
MTPTNGMEFYRAVADLVGDTGRHRGERRNAPRGRRRRRVRRALGVRLVNAGLRLIDGAVRSDGRPVARVGIGGR